MTFSLQKLKIIANIIKKHYNVDYNNKHKNSIHKKLFTTQKYDIINILVLKSFYEGRKIYE